MPVQTLRHEQVFSAATFNPRRVDVVGCGALGSRVAMSLAKLGVETLHLWDFDVIADHNVPNQLFGNHQVGKPKLETLAEMILESTSCRVSAHPCRCEGDQPLGSIVFMCVDSMAVRKNLWEKQIKYMPCVDLLVESRMGADSGRVYAVQSCNPQHVEQYESTLYGDDEAETSVCGSSISVGPTAELISGLAVWQFIKWWRWSQRVQPTDVEPESEIVITTRQTMMILGRRFE